VGTLLSRHLIHTTKLQRRKLKKLKGEWMKKEKGKKNRGQGESWRKWKEEKCEQTEVGGMIS
jgi:hypothetical protein